MSYRRFRLLLILGAISSLVLAACGGGEEEAAPQPTTPAAATAAPAAATAPVAQPTATPRPTAAPAPTPTAAPVSRGELTLTLQNLASFGMFPFPSNTVTDNSYLDVIYDFVIATRAGKLDFTSGFATSATANGDSTVWTIKTRTGVAFQNGDPATAKDLAFGVALWTSKETTITTAFDLQRVLTKIETPDDQTTVFTLSEPNLFFAHSILSPLATGGLPLHVWPQKYYDSVGGWKEVNKKPVGSGPYKLKSLIVGDRVVVEAVDRHWYYGVPRTKTVTFFQIPEETTRIALLKTGDSDFATISERSAASLKASGLTIFSESGRGHLVIFPHRITAPLQNGDPNPLSKEDVRKAMVWHALDRPALVAAFFPVSGAVAMDYPVNPADFAFDPNNKTPVPPYDPAKARALLAQAGYPRGFELDVYNWREELAEPFEAISVYWEQIGIKVNRIPITLRSFTLLALGSLKDGWKRASVSGPSVQPDLPIAANNQPKNGHNPGSAFFVTDEPEVLRRARAWFGSTTLDDYVKAGREYQRYVVSEQLLGWWPVLRPAQLAAGSSKVPKGWAPSFNARLHFADAAATR